MSEDSDKKLDEVLAKGHENLLASLERASGKTTAEEGDDVPNYVYIMPNGDVLVLRKRSMTTPFAQAAEIVIKVTPGPKLEFLKVRNHPKELFEGIAMAYLMTPEAEADFLKKIFTDDPELDS